MTTVLDPLGTPTIIYSKSGKNIQNIIASSGSTFVNAVVIPHVSEETIVILDAQMSAGALYFAADFDLGDTVRIMTNGSNNGNACYVYNSNGSPRGNLTAIGFAKFILLDPSTQDWKQLA